MDENSPRRKSIDTVRSVRSIRFDESGHLNPELWIFVVALNGIGHSPFFFFDGIPSTRCQVARLTITPLEPLSLSVVALKRTVKL